MTQTHHTPHPFGGPLSSAAVNAPLASLDSAIATRTFEEFGATGGADDTTALQAAFTAGGTIVAKQGRTYITTATLTLIAGTTLMLHGATIKLRDGTAPKVLLDVSASTEASPIRIVGGTLNGNRDNSTWDGLTLPTYALVSVGAGHGVEVREAYLKSGWYGVSVSTGTHSLISGNRFEGLSIGCYYLGGAAVDWPTTRIDHQATIIGNRFSLIGFHAIWFAASKNGRITGNHIAGDHNITHRIDVYPDSTTGLLLMRPTPASGYTDFADVLHTTYFIAGVPWSDSSGVEIGTTKKVSSSLVRVSFFAPSGGARSVFTITGGVAATGVITSTAHGLQNGDPIVFVSLTGGTGLSVDSNPDTMVPYYVINRTADTFQIAATSGGAAITSPGWSTNITAGFGGIFMENQPASSGTGDLISIAESNDMVISGNTVLGGTAGGIVVFGRSRRVTVTGNTCNGQGYAAVSIAYYTDAGGADAPSDFVVTGNNLMNSWRNEPNIAGPWNWAIQVVGAATGIVEGNTVVDDGVDIEAWVAAAPVPFTIGNSGSDNIFDTTAAHGLAAGDIVVFTSLAGTGAGSFNVTSTHPLYRYYVIAANLTATTFQVALTRGGAAVAFGGTITSGTGTYLGIGQSDHWLGTQNVSAKVSTGINRVKGQVSTGVASGSTIAADSDLVSTHTTLGLTIGTNVQAYDADLTAIAALTSAADKVPYATGAGTWALTDLTATGRALIDDASTTAQRATLGLTGLAWSTVAGTSFPGSPTTSDRFFRTDRGLEYYYDGTRWLTMTEYAVQMLPAGTDATQGTNTPVTLTAPTDEGANGAWATRYVAKTFEASNDASNYVTWTLASRTATFTSHTIASFNTSADTAGQTTRHSGTIGAAVTSGDLDYLLTGAKTLSPTTITIELTLFYRFVG